MKWWTKAMGTLKTAKWHPLYGVIFSSMYHTKQLNPWANSSASHEVKYSWLSACQGRWSHLKITQAFMNVQQASETSHNKSSLWQLSVPMPKLLVNVYRYYLMVKVCLLVVYVEVDFSLIQSHINLFDFINTNCATHKDLPMALL